MSKYVPIASKIRTDNGGSPWKPESYRLLNAEGRAKVHQRRGELLERKANERKRARELER